MSVHRGPEAAEAKRAFLYDAGYSAVIKPKSFEREPSLATSKPSATNPRLSNSRTADARLGMRFKNRQLSIIFTSAGFNMI